jgi:hypothetical protein
MAQFHWRIFRCWRETLTRRGHNDLTPALINMKRLSCQALHRFLYKFQLLQEFFIVNLQSSTFFTAWKLDKCIIEKGRHLNDRNHPERLNKVQVPA